MQNAECKMQNAKLFFLKFPKLTKLPKLPNKEHSVSDLKDLISFLKSQFTKYILNFA